MKKMILSALSVLSILTVSAPAYSADTVMHVLECHDARPIMDAGYFVNIDAVIPQYGRMHILRANLGSISIAYPQLLGTYAVTRQQSPAFGSPVRFSGRDFDLEVNVDGTPIQGGHSASFSAETKNGRVAGELICRFTR